MKNNIVYLMKDEKRDCCLFKVGFAKNLLSRVYTQHTIRSMNVLVM